LAISTPARISPIGGEQYVVDAITIYVAEIGHLITKGIIIGEAKHCESVGTIQARQFIHRRRHVPLLIY
tara:strand:+ start:243 stop:449 length:207 start_codon:yes stop_codon:yes gene_type:complete